MKKEKIETIILNNNTGEIEKELQEGDSYKIITKEQKQALKEKKEKEDLVVEINKSKTFTKIYDSAIYEIIKLNLNLSEYLIILFLIVNIRYETGIVAKENGEIITVKDIINKTKFSKQTVINSLKRLQNEKIIAKIKCGRESSILVNPYIFCKGKFINKTLQKTFQKTLWNSDI